MNRILALFAISLGLLLNIVCVAAPERPPSPTPTPYDAGGPRKVKIGERFLLKVGDYVQVELENGSAALHFKEVVNDSRCPRDVTCIRAGDATVIMTGVGKDGKPEDIRMVMESSREAKGQFGNLEITVFDLSPYPESTTPIPSDAYRVTVVVNYAWPKLKS